MIQNILTVGNQVLILFILIAIGVCCNKAKLFGGIAVKGMTNLVLYIVTPCVIINSFCREFNSQMLKGLFITVIAAIITYIIFIAISLFVIHDKDTKREKVLRFGSVFANCGFMSLPLQAAILGSDGVFFGAVYIAIFNITFWTYGVYLMSGDRKNVSGKKLILNPGIIGTILGIIVFLIPYKLPETLGTAIGHMAALNTPLPMVVIGYHLAESGLKIKGVSVYLAMILKLIVFPLIMLLGCLAFGISGIIMISLVISAASPIAAVTTMFSERFGQDTPLSASIVSVSTLLSIITMPIIIGLAMAF